SAREHRPEPLRHVIVGISHMPSSSLELVLSRCTEVGAGAFHVVQADRSVARGARYERWQAICREAAMLAGRLRVPIVAGPSPLEDVPAARPEPVILVRGGPVDQAETRDERAGVLLVWRMGGRPAMQPDMLSR